MFINMRRLVICCRNVVNSIECRWQIIGHAVRNNKVLHYYIEKKKLYNMLLNFSNLIDARSEKEDKAFGVK